MSFTNQTECLIFQQNLHSKCSAFWNNTKGCKVTWHHMTTTRFNKRRQMSQQGIQWHTAMKADVKSCWNKCLNCSRTKLIENDSYLKSGLAAWSEPCNAFHQNIQFKWWRVLTHRQQKKIFHRHTCIAIKWCVTWHSLRLFGIHSCDMLLCWLRLLCLHSCRWRWSTVVTWRTSALLCCIYQQHSTCSH